MDPNTHEYRDINELRLLWLIGNDGLFDGPLQDWKKSHKELILKYVKNFNTVIQAGGGCGMYPLLLNKMFKHVITFEPSPVNFHCLDVNCKSKGIEYHNFGLSSCYETLYIDEQCKNNTGTFTIHKEQTPGNAFTPNITLIPLDSYHYKNIDLLMLDLEGFEIHALHGAKETIKKWHPVIFCENGNGPIEEFLSKFGYKIVDKSQADTIYAVV